MILTPSGKPIYANDADDQVRRLEERLAESQFGVSDDLRVHDLRESILGVDRSWNPYRGLEAWLR